MSAIDHIGIAVADLEAAIKFFNDVFGLEVYRTIEDPGRLKAAFLAWGGASLELVQRLEAADVEALGGAQGRLEHVAIAVDNISAEILRLNGLGVLAETAEPRTLAGTRAIFIDADTTNGVPLQLVQDESDDA